MKKTIKSTINNKFKEFSKLKKEVIIFDGQDENLHKAYTKNWEETTKVKEALPIKIAGKVVKKVRKIEDKKEKEDKEDNNNNEYEYDNSENESENSESENELKTKSFNNLSEFEMPEELDFDIIDDQPLINNEINHENNNLIHKNKNNNNDKNDKNDKVDKIDKNNKISLPSSLSFEKKKLLIAEICHSITTDPMKAFRKSSRSIDELEEHNYKIADIFAFLHDDDFRIQEIAMLSCYLLFKDICPGYKIRKQDETDSSILHKKETKRLRDYDLSILSNYMYFLKYLSKKVTELGSLKRTEPITDSDGKILISWKLGVSALRIQCELLKSLSHFNHRSNLLTSIIYRAGQFVESISSLCCQTIQTLLQNDKDSELTFEIIQLIGKYLTQTKYNVPEQLIKSLEFAKLKIHSDMGKDIRKKVKQNKRKRKRDEENIEANIQETDMSSQLLIAKRFQADALHELCIIYFRVIKLKVGFSLLPAALHGLSRIIHLINIEMVEDLVILLKGLIQPSNCTLSPELKLLCIHCAIISLSGPGQELGIDDEIFIVQLRTTIIELPYHYSHWNIVFQCIELCFMKRRDVRNTLILSFVSILLHLSCNLTCIQTSITAITLAHSILLRYPRTRENITFLQRLQLPTSKSLSNLIIDNNNANNNNNKFIPSYIQPQQDDEVGDLSMLALRKDTKQNGINNGLQPSGIGVENDEWSDGSWIYPLLKNHYNSHQYISILKPLIAPNIIPVPLRIQEILPEKELQLLIHDLDRTFNNLPSKRNNLKQTSNVDVKKVEKKMTILKNNNQKNNNNKNNNSNNNNNNQKGNKNNSFKKSKKF